MSTVQGRVDDATRQAQEGIDATQRYAQKAVSRIADRAAEWADEARPAINRATERAQDWARQGAQWVSDGSDRVRTQVTRASDRTIDYMRDEPLKSVLMAAAAGALLFAVVKLIGGRSER